MRFTRCLINGKKRAKSESQYSYLLIMFRSTMKFGGRELMNTLNLPRTIVSTSAIEKYIEDVQ